MKRLPGDVQQTGPLGPTEFFNVLDTEPGWKLAYEDSVADIYVRAR